MFSWDTPHVIFKMYLLFSKPSQVESLIKRIFWIFLLFPEIYTVESPMIPETIQISISQEIKPQWIYSLIASIDRAA